MIKIISGIRSRQLEQRSNTFTILSVVFGILTFFSLPTVVLPYFFGSLSIIFAVLSKGSSFKMTPLAKTAVALSVSGMILITALAGAQAYRLYTDDAYFAEVNEQFEKINGMTMEEYMHILEELYRTGEIPEELLEELERTGY